MLTKLFNKQPQRKHKKRKGALFSTEMQLVMAFVGIIVAVIATTMGDESEANLISDAEKALISAQQKAKQNMGGFDNYTGFSTSDCWDKNLFPTSWKSSTHDEFTTPFSDNGLTCGAVDTATNIAGITSTGTGKYITFTFSGVETEQCNQLVSRVFQNFVEIQVAGTRINSNTTLNAQCSSASEVAITFIGR